MKQKQVQLEYDVLCQEAFFSEGPGEYIFATYRLGHDPATDIQVTVNIANFVVCTALVKPENNWKTMWNKGRTTTTSREFAQAVYDYSTRILAIRWHYELPLFNDEPNHKVLEKYRVPVRVNYGIDDGPRSIDDDWE